MASRYCIIGKHGLIGSALAKRLVDVTSYPTDQTRVLFHFGSYTHPTFEANPEYFMQQTMHDFAQLLPYCYERGIMFVYPSSALVYEKETTFSRFKKTLEDLVGCYKALSLGLRIFPVYGPGEDSTVISQWCRAMAKGERPLVFGNGEQTRDFIFVDDVVDQIMLSVEATRWHSRVVDIGTGVSTSFNAIVRTINAALGTSLIANYVQRPSSYSEGIVCADPLPHKVSVEEGIQRILGAKAPLINCAYLGGPRLAFSDNIPGPIHF